MNTIQFDQLPDLCLRKIFSFLSLRDLAKCRAVNRQFKYYVDQSEVTEVVVREREKYHNPFKNWFQTDRPIDFEGAISLNAFKSVKSSPFNLEQQLKFLYIFQVDNISIYFTLNSLEELVHLEIYSNINSSEETMKLALPNLKVFAIRGHASILVLATPKLEVLKCIRSKIQLEYPETIKRLKFYNESRDDLSRHDLRELTKLSSLEALHVVLDYEGALDGVRLSDLAYLKELTVTCHVISYRRTYEELRRSLHRLMRERNALLRDELRMCLNDVLLVDTKQLPMYDQQPKSENAFKFMNYRLLRRDSYPEVTSVYFHRLIELDFEISEDFFERFPRIQYLIATDRVDQEQLEWFFQNATALNLLELTQTRLGQAFVDRLPKLCSRLVRLELYENSGLITKFQFLLQFEHLEVFKTDRPFHSFDLVANAFRQLEKLERLLCRAGNAFVEVERSSSLEDSYSLRFYRDVRKGKPIQILATFHQENLSWAQVVAVYEQRSAGPIDEPRKKMRIKRLK